MKLFESRKEKFFKNLTASFPIIPATLRRPRFFHCNRADF